MELIWSICHVNRKNTLTEEDSYHEAMLQCLKDFRWEDTANKSVVMVGPPGCGKTNWAKKRATKPALFVTHLDGLKHYDPNYHKSIIFDDMDFHRLPRPTQIFLLDRENMRDIHVRYSVVNIPAGVEKYFTANMDPFPRGDPALERRMQCINVNVDFAQSLKNEGKMRLP